MSGNGKIDSHLSWLNAKGIIERDVKAGKLDPQQAKKILEKARISYRNQEYNRQIERLNR